MPPLRWTAAGLRRLGLHGRGLVVAVPLVWLLVFFLVPFLVVAKISVSAAAIAMPPYLPLVEWDGEQAVITLNLGNFLYLLDDPLYLNAYLSSLRIAFVSAVVALLVGYPIAYYIARSPEPRRSILLTLVILPFWTSFLLTGLRLAGLPALERGDQQLPALDLGSSTSRWSCCRPTSRSISGSSTPTCRS